jgi:hypothetical protein
METEKNLFTQVCVMHFEDDGTIPEANLSEIYIEQLSEHFNVRLKNIGFIKTSKSLDLLFYISTDDIMKFAVKRLAANIRWFEDVVLNNYSHYSSTVVEKYYSWEDKESVFAKVEYANA